MGFGGFVSVVVFFLGIEALITGKKEQITLIPFSFLLAFAVLILGCGTCFLNMTGLN
jgi:hypothetical protein